MLFPASKDSNRLGQVLGRKKKKRLVKSYSFYSAAPFEFHNHLMMPIRSQGNYFMSLNNILGQASTMMKMKKDEDELAMESQAPNSMIKLQMFTFTLR